MTKEYELKLSLTPEIARKLAKAKGLSDVRNKGSRKRRLVSTYFDTPQHVLRKSGLALRIRDDGKKHTQTLKAPTSGPAGLQNHEEWSAVVEEGRPDLSRIGDEDLAKRLARRRSVKRLDPVFTTDIERTTKILKTGGAKIELAIDQGEIRTGDNGASRIEPVCEAELELVSGDPGPMLDLALRLCETYDIRLAHRTKAERGYALARPALRPRPVKARHCPLDPDMRAGEAFDAIIANALEQLFHNREPTLRGDPEGVHQSRVAMRRLRAALRTFKKLLPYDKRKAFNGEFRWFQQRLSPSRDWHVFLDETLPKIHKAHPDRAEAVDRLRRLARAERRRGTLDGIEYLESRRHARLILQFERWVSDLRGGMTADAFELPIQTFARRVLRKTHREVMRDPRPLSRMPPDDLHELRKHGKKLRYAGEFLSDLWPREESAPFLKLLERLQKTLGEVNDAAVARQILLTVGPHRVDPEVLALVEEWSRKRIANRIRKATPYWRKLRAAQPFWDA